MKVANIVYDAELVNHNKVDYINYVNDKVSYEELDKTLPTLYVGWSFMKSCNFDNEIIQNADILKKSIIKNKLFWELSFKEGKSSHVKGVENFTNSAPNIYFKHSFNYNNIDPVFNNIKKHDDLMNLIPKSFDSTYVYKDEMIYGRKDNNIWGINLRMFEFFKFDTEKLIIDINDRTKSTISDISGNYYQSYYKIFPNFEQLRRYIVTI